MKSKHGFRILHLLVISFLIIGNFLAGATPAFAQTGSAVSSATPSDAAPDVGDTITVTINIDVSGVDSPDDALGSYTGTLNWDTDILEYQSYSGAPPSGFTGIVNTDDVASGLITFNGANASGATGNTVVLVITFDVIGGGTSDLDLAYSAMAAASTFNSLLSILTVNDGEVEVATSVISLDGAVSSTTADGVSSVSFSHTTGTGVNRLLMVGASSNSYNSAQTISSVTFTPSGESAIALSEVGSIENESGRLSAIYGLVNPPSGAAGTVTITYSGTVNYGIVAGAANFAGVNQSDPFDTYTSAVGTESSSISVDVPSDPNDLVFDNVFLGAATLPSLAVGGNQDQLWNATVDRARGAASYETATSTSTAMSWTPSGGSSSYYWAIGAVPINPAPSGTVYELTIAVDPTGGGTTTPSVGVHSYLEDEVVGITANPATDYEFDHWSGACTGEGACSVTMTSDKSVTAHFAVEPEEIDFTGEEMLGRPTDTSISVKVVPDAAITLYYEYGTTSGVYTGQTSQVAAPAGEPTMVVIDGLDANTKYYYRMQYSPDGGTTWIDRPEYSFQTQRAKGSTFSFTITTDSHVNILLGDATRWQNTLNDVAADNPDFHFDLGDTFDMRSISAGDVSGAENSYIYQLPFFNTISHSAPVFLTPGNHEQQEAWHLLAPLSTSLPVIGTNAQKKFFLNPVPDSFYSGDTDEYASLDGDHLKEDYYSWEWGDALFVVINPYWYTTTKPYVSDPGGGETDTTGSGDTWDWTLGQAQFNWLKQTLSESNAPYKFVLTHQLVSDGSISGQEDYGHGGANTSHIGEWGGYNENGTTYGWNTERAGWGDETVHDMLVNYGVSAFFHAHDHQYAYEIKDGVVYQAVPAAGFTGNGFNIYTTGEGYTIKALPSSGHLKVTVSPAQTTVDYIQTSETTVEYSYTIAPGVYNQPPEVSDIPNQTIAEGATFTQINLDDFVSDPDDDDADMEWTFSGNTDLSVSIVNRVATIGIPDADWNGAETITFTATDPGDLYDEDEATFTVTAVNDAPVVSDIPNQSIAEGSTFAAINLDDYVSDVDNTDAEMTWTFSGSSDLSVSIVDRVVTIGIPDADWNGAETITFKATDPGALHDDDGATFTVTAVNDSPVVSDIPDQSIAEGSTFATINLDDYVSDVDNTDAEMTWTFSGNSDLSVSIVDQVATIGIPDADWNGAETITFKATDPGALHDEDEATFTVTGVNDTPVVSDIPDQSITEGSTFATINLDDYVSDVDNTDAEMTWTFSGNSDLSVSIVDRVATIGVPDADWNGAETITFKATDPGALYDEDEATFTVTSVNDAPVVSNIPDQTINEGETFATINLDDYVSDVDNTDAEMTWISSGNSELSVSIVDRVATIGIPDADWNGAETITFKATDPGALHDDDGATFTVTAVNDTPVVSDIPDQTINEGESFATINLDDYVSDVDNTDAEMTWTSSGNSELSVSIVNRVATIIIPDADWNGAETITFRATDPGDLYNQDEANFTVTGVNDAPVVSDIPDQTINEGETFATIALDDYVMDVDNTDAEMVWTHVGDDDLNVSIIDRLVTISVPDVDWNGSETINFKATDPGALHDENAATFTVLAVNDAPVADAQSVSTDEDTAKAITLTGSDVEDDELTYEVVDTPTHGTLSGTAPDLIYTPDADYFGDDSFTFKVNDGAVDSAEAMVSITVNPVNDAPVAVDDATSTAEDTALVLSQADLTGNDTDVDNLSTELSVMAVGNPVNGAVVLDAGVITFTPDQDFVGPAEFDYTVSDGVLMDEGHVLIDVTAVNDAPVITEGESKLVHMSQNGDPIPFNLTLHATDTEDDELAWSIISLASHGEAVAGGTGVIGYTPDEDFTGDDSFVVQVSDGNGGVDTILINVSITPFGPVITVFLPVMIY